MGLGERGERLEVREGREEAGEVKTREALEFELKSERLANLLGLILSPGHSRSP